jgi:hypothetical protein
MRFYPSLAALPQLPTARPAYLLSAALSKHQGDIYLYYIDAGVLQLMIYYLAAGRNGISRLSKARQEKEASTPSLPASLCPLAAPFCTTQHCAFAGRCARAAYARAAGGGLRQLRHLGIFGGVLRIACLPATAAHRCCRGS